jgi:site-specific DNA recombinase
VIGLLPAALYLRQSSDREGDHLAVDRQREACLELCRRKGWEVKWTFTDNDVSASSGKKRPAYQRLLADVESGQIKAIATWHLDRLHRRPVELEHFIDLADRHGVALATATGDVDLGTSTGRMVARVMGAAARHEVEQKAARQRLSNRQGAEQGRVPGSRRPFGYEPGGMVVREAEAAVVRSGFDRLLSGASLRSIAHEWNASGLTGDGRYGKRGANKDGTKQKSVCWRPDSVRFVLTNPRHAAIRVYEGKEYPGSWPALVSEDSWRSAKALLEDPSRRTTPSNARRYLLSGYATCFCGALTTTGRTQHGRRTYRCSQHMHLSRSAEPVDDFVRALVIERLSRPDALDLLVDQTAPQADELRQERLALVGRREEAAQAFAAGTIPLSQVVAINSHIDARLAALDDVLLDAQRGAALAGVLGDPATAWDSMDVGRRRGVLDVLLDVQLHPPGRGKRTFDPTSVEIRWKGSALT